MAPTSATLVRDFCEPEGDSLSRRLFRALLATWTRGVGAETRTLFARWQRLFRLAHEEAGKQKADEARRRALEALAGERFAAGDDDREYEVLYCLQTTHAILVKAIAHTVLAGLDRGIGLSLHAMSRADDSELRTEIARWESGCLLRAAGLYNVVEADDFRWYCTAPGPWTPELATVLRDLVRTLLPHAGSGPPDGDGEDLFQEVYLRIVPAKVRHTLGEFYTPRWLAETVVSEALSGVRRDGWRGLDPCCGSGTFLSILIDRVLRELDSAPAEEKLDAILDRVRGFDLNPLAVLTARVNYFARVAPLLQAGRAVEIPVFLGDAAAALGRSRDRGRVASDPYRTAALPPFDILVGNPPWIDWKNLPENYRERVKSLCIDRRLFSGDAHTGGINLNICALVANVSAERWLRRDGQMAFLMPRSLLYQQSYEGFRNLRLDSGRLYFQRIVDWSEAGHPFHPVTERFCTYVLGRRAQRYETGIPRRIVAKRPGTSPRTIGNARRWDGDVEALFEIRDEVVGQVLDDRTMFTNARDARELAAIRLVAGKCDYVGREGIEFYPQELFLHRLEPGGSPPTGTVLLRNFQNPASKYRLAETVRALETEFVHPLVRGPEIGPFLHTGSEFLVPFPYDTGDRRRPLKPVELRRRAPKLFRFLQDHKEVIQSQTAFNERILGANATQFYALARVGAYSFAEHRVGFRDNTAWAAAVFSPVTTPWGERKIPLFQNHAASIAEHESGRFLTEDEAHYVCAILNCPVVARYIRASSDARTFKIRPPVRVPTFDPADAHHRALAAASRTAHERARAGDAAGVAVQQAVAEKEYLRILRADAPPTPRPPAPPPRRSR